MNEFEELGADAAAESGAEGGEPAEGTTGTEGESGEAAEGEAESGAEGLVQDEETTEFIIDSSQFASEVAVLEEKFDILTGQVTMAADKITGCYCMLLILAVLSLKNLFSRRIVRKVRGGMEDV